MSMRLDGGNPKTGELVALTVEDVAAIASAFDLDPHELLQRAERATVENGPELDELRERRPRAARRRPGEPKMGDD